MRIRFFVLNIFIILIIFLSLNLVISDSALSLPPQPPPLSVDKDIYQVEETVELNINIDPLEYHLYELHIYAHNNSYTYKGDFNPIMFFYPTEEGIYTIALVDFSTRATFYSLDFRVGREEEGGVGIDVHDPVQSFPEPAQQGQEFQVKDVPDNIPNRIISVSTDKDEYTSGENVRIFVEGTDGINGNDINLYHSFNGVSKRYMGDLKYINFIPQGIGSHELILEDVQNNIKYIYNFEVKRGIAKKILKAINSRGYEEEVDLEVLDENQGLASVEITPRKRILKKISLKNLKIGENLSLGIEEIALQRIRIKQRNVVKAFALDPSKLEFENGTATGVASGSELWKCKDWDFDNQQCLGTWQKIMDLVPGQEYVIDVSASDPGYAETGVASINTKKPVYHPGETSELIIVVLDTAGHLVSGASVNLDITAPDNSVYYFSTSNTSNNWNNKIIETDKGVYEASFNNTNLEGNYSLVVRAIESNVNSTIFSYFTVKAFYEFDIIRDTPVTTDPWRGAFISSISLTSYLPAPGFNFTEVLPSSFTISNHGGAMRTENNEKIYLTWTNLNNNSVVSYSARPPLVTPELYELGPSYVDYSSGIFYEARPWYLAVDPTAYYDPESNVQQGWDDGTGTGYDQVNNSVRYPNTVGMTYNYISARGNDATYAEFGFDNITQTPRYITLWIYANTTNCGFLAYLQQGGTTRGTIDVNPSTSLNWFNYNWTAPSGDYSVMTVEFYQDSKGGGGPGYCYVYEAYLEVAYNNPPNITALTYPVDGANLSSGTNVDFNFTVYDEEDPVKNCTLWGNFTGTWAANKTVYDVDVDTESNITINLPDGSFIWNINCTDKFGDWDEYETDYRVRVDTTYPKIDFSSGTEPNGTYANRNWIYVNVSVNESNEKNITFRLYNVSGEVNISTYTNGRRNINFTSLDSNTKYWYNVTVCDHFGWCNSTSTRKITLDSTYPAINYSTGTEPNGTHTNRNWIYINITANETNEANITFRLYNTTSPVNITTLGPGNRSINFTNLDSNIKYWYNVTITDKAGNQNTTETWQITLDSTYPFINLNNPGNNTFINYDMVEFNYTPIDTYLDTCILYANFTGPFGPNETEPIPINGSINTFGPINLNDGRYIWNVWCNDSAGNSNFSQYNYTIKVDTQNPVISNWNTNGTSFVIYEYICLNVTVTDSFSGVQTVYAEIEDPNTDVENVSMLDNGGGCDAVGGDNVYSVSYYLEFGGNYTWLNTHAKDYANNWQTNTTNLEWNVTTTGSMTVNMTYPSSNLEINESEYNYQYQQTCNVSCDAGGINCENVVLYAEYNPSVFKYINTTTIDLINDEDSFSCGNLTAGGSPCTHTFNITSGSNSGDNIWPIRCSASSTNVGSYISSDVNLTINDHPFVNFIYPSNSSWLAGVEMLNASASFDSDGSLINFLFEYDNNTGFISPSTICNGPDENCTWNTSQQDQCANNSLSCYLRLTITDNDGLTNSTYVVIGFDTQAPTIVLGLPRDFENISVNLFTINASPTDNQSGVDTVVFEYRQNSTDSWHFVCLDNRSPIYDCVWNLTNLSDGNTYEFRAYANDSKGNIGSADVHTNITVDRTGPLIYLESPIYGANFSNNTITFYYNATDATSSLRNCSLVIDGSIVNTTLFPAEDTTLNFTYNLSDGSYNWSVNCTDLLGNENSSELREINIDTQGPVVVLDRPPNSSIVTGASYVVNASVNDPGFAEVDTATFEYRRNSTDTWQLICRDDRDPVYDCDWDTTVLPDGDEYEVRVYANDTFGNVGNIDIHVNITIDNNNPVLILVSPEDNFTDTDGDLVFVYRVSDISPISNCTLIINEQINQTEPSVQRDVDQYFYLYNVVDGSQLNWSINCTDSINLINASETRNITVSISANMNLNLTMNKSSYYAGQTAVITHNVTDTADVPISGVDVSTAIVFANTTIPWWNSSWQRRKPINLTSSQDLTNVIVEVNVSGLDGNISSCTDEIRIARFDSNNNLTSVPRAVVSGDDFTYCVVRFKATMSAGVDNTEFWAYYNNSGASDPNNNVTRLTVNTIKTALGGSILGAQYDVTSGSSSDTTSDNTVYYAVGRNNGPPDQDPLNAYINLSYNVSDLGVTESDLVSFNFTINYCHSNDVAAPITCGGAITSATANPASVQLYDFDATGWDPQFDTVTQDVNSAAENTETYIETDSLGSYVQDSTGMVWIRYETDISFTAKGTDGSFALDYATLNVYYKERIYTGLGSVGSTQLIIASNYSQTDFQGLWVWNWSTSGQQSGNYSTVSLASKTGYYNAYDYYWFEIEEDTTGPVVVLDRPHNHTTINALIDGFLYLVNATVTDAGIGTIDTLTFLYRRNDTDTWKFACNDTDGSAPFECNWNLTGLPNGEDYEVRVYANDTLGNIGNNDTHINITIITQEISITYINVDDNVYSPVDEIDLIAGSTKNIYCNITVNDPNGYTYIEGVNATFFSATTTYDAADNNRTHYTNTSCTLLSGVGQSADYQCIFKVWHFAINGTWNCTAIAWSNFTSDNASDNTSVNQLFALNISTNLIDYTNLEPNQTSPNVQVNMSNVGNMPMNISVYGFGGDDEATGTDLSMTCEINNISISFERYSTTSGVTYNSKNQLSSTPQDIGLTIPPKANESDVKLNTTYWQFMVPPEEYTLGECNGSVVFVAESP